MVFAALLTACNGTDGKSPARKKAMTKTSIGNAGKFVVAATPTLDCLPLFLLADSMLYDTAQVHIHLKQYTAHMDIDTALVGGSAQVAATELVRAIDLHRTHGVRLRPVAATPLQWILVGNKNNKIVNMKALGDHMIAMTRFSATDWLTTLVRKRAKTDRPVFAVQMNDVQTRLKMMLSNEMDAAWLPEPQATVALSKKNIDLMHSDKEGREYGVVVFRESYGKDLGNREAELEEFKHAYDRAVDLINTRGLRYYAALVEKHTGADAKIVAKLPKITFKHTGELSRADMIAAGKIRFQKHTPRVRIQ